jgi:2-hydroxy-3-oxopropionate reductase
MTTVGFIGFGVMGAPMASNLARNGFDVVGYSRTRERVSDRTGDGVTVADSLEALVQSSDVVISMLPDSPDVESVVLGEHGVLAHATAGLLYIDMSTIRPDVAQRIEANAASRGIDALDAPVSGGEAGAIEGTLSIMVGGSLSAFNRARPLFAAMGRTVVHVGPAGSGQTVKAANQLMVAANLQGLAEAIVFLEAHSVDMASALEVLGGGLAGSAVLQRKSTNMLERSFDPGFRLNLFEKDMRIIGAAAQDKGITLLLGALVAQLISSLVARGDGALDHSAMIRVVDELSKR